MSPKTLQSIPSALMWVMKHTAIRQWIVAGAISWLFLLPGVLLAQEESEYFEIPVFLNISKIGGVEVPAIIDNNNNVSLSVTDVFNFLKIKNVPSKNFDTITGFFVREDLPYFIDRTNNVIQFGDKTFHLNPGDLIETETGLFLGVKYFGSIFGLDCKFDFRSLSVKMNSKMELPIIREMRLEMMRENIKRLKGEVKADTTIGRSYPLFSLGMFDWAVYSTQFSPGPSATRLNLSLGSIIAGGEANVSLNHTTGTPFLERRQYYLWRFANNDFKVMKQAMLGKINPEATSSIYHPVVGAKITNAPTTYRRSFGTFTISDHTKPGWTVELYVNNVLVDYQQADASGFYSFDVPLVYGSSEIKLRFYGPWGEERSQEKNINIPYSFLPKNHLEYTVTGGMVEDTSHSIYSRGEIGYGVGKSVTIGGGVEYLSSVTASPVMPFAKAAFNLFNNLLLSATYTHNVQIKSLLNYRLYSGLQFELSYIKYKQGQQAINNNYLEERKALVTFPIRMPKFSMFTRFSFSQYVLPESRYSNVEFLLSGNVLGVNTNFTTYAIFSSLPQPYVYSMLALAFRLPANIIITPQVNYEYNENRFISARCEVEKRIFKNSYIVGTYDANFKSKTQNVQVGVRIDFPFAQTSFFARRDNHLTSFIESARGSMMLSSKTGYTSFSNRQVMGRGGLIILPFLDINCNGKRDKGEPKVAGLNLHVTGGMVKEHPSDTTIIISDLEAYTKYFLELDRNSFDNIAWQLQKLTYSIAINPNQLRVIEIPVAVVGEAAGMVYLEKATGPAGQGQITINFYDSGGRLVGSTLSEPDGYFSYLGLPPGTYIAKPDPHQMQKLGMLSTPGSFSFTIHEDEEGDYIDTIEFILKKQ